jgi:hypothetical protein
MATKELTDRVAAIEAQLGEAQPQSRSDRPSLAAEINELETRLEAMSYMDDDIEDFGVGDIVLDEPGCEGMGVEVGMDDEFVNGEDVDVIDDDEFGMDEEFGGPMMASEATPGIEDEITQDSFKEVEEEAHGVELTTGDSMLDVAPTGHTASEEYVARLVKASTRLDRVASYLERQGNIELAERIDKIADTIDVRANKASRRA